MPLSNKKRRRQRRSVADSLTIAAATGPPVPSSNRQGGRPGNPPRTGVAHPPPPLFDLYTTLEKKEEEEEEEEEAFTCIGMMEPRPAAAGESSKGGDKGRRFSEEQIRLMETMFEAQAKLEPRQKLELARELGLQPRQVAIWFQNKRARWKSKQLEREYRALKAEHDALLASFDSLKKEKQILLGQLRALEELLEKADERRSNDGDAASEREQRAARLLLKEEPEFELAGSAGEEADLGQPASFSMASAAAAATEQQFWFTNTTTTTAAAATSSWPSEQSGSHSQWWEFCPLRG